jgi:hypothetical protein
MMAESKPKRTRKSSSSSASSSRKSNSRSGGSSSEASTSRDSSAERRDTNRRSPKEIVLEATRQLQELIGRPVESVIGIERNGKEWHLSVEVLELERVPNTTDVMGKYEVTVDHNGDLTGARRTRRYARAEAGED